jgi:hypothetical protein
LDAPLTRVNPEMPTTTHVDRAPCKQSLDARYASTFGNIGSRMTRCGDPNSIMRNDPNPRLTPQHGSPRSLVNDRSIWFMPLSVGITSRRPIGISRPTLRSSQHNARRPDRRPRTGDRRLCTRLPVHFLLDPVLFELLVQVAAGSVDEFGGA